MFFTTTGEAAAGLHVIGSREVPCYLLDGEEPVLFDSGFAALGPAYLQDIQAVLGTQRRPQTLFITHVHFDHCGSAAFFQEHIAGLSIAASAKAAAIIQRPGAVKLIGELNQHVADQIGGWKPDFQPGPPFAPFSIDRIVEDGQRIELAGGLTVEVIATPGHTWDFLSYYIPERKILIASEAVGCPDATGGNIVTEFLVDYQAYMDSMARLAGLEVQVLCPGHRMVFTGRDAADYIARSRESAKTFKARVDELLREEGGDQERVTARVKAEEWDPRPYPKQPEPAYLLNLRARVKHLAEVMAGR